MSTITEERALTLLSTGLPAETVAASLGVTPGYISQLISEEAFAEKLSAMRYQNLQKHNERDSSYDAIEDTLLEKLKDTIPLMFKPGEILKAIQVVNGAKRRGQATPEAIIEKQQIVNLVIPINVLNQFRTNSQNQVTDVGQQSLLTMQAGTLANVIKEREVRNDSPRIAERQESTERSRQEQDAPASGK